MEKGEKTHEAAKTDENKLSAEAERTKTKEANEKNPCDEEDNQQSSEEAQGKEIDSNWQIGNCLQGPH